MINKDFKSIIDLLQSFSDEQTCIDHLAELRWNGNIVSPFDPSSKVYICKDNKYRCKNTSKYFNVKTSTLFDNTKIALQKWFLAIWLVTSHKKGISSVQLAKDINVTQKTSWYMLQRIRRCFGDDNKVSQKMTTDVEVDETYVGGKNKNRHKDKKYKYSQGRSYKDKTPVFGILERGGRLVAKVVKDVKGNTLKPIIFANAQRGAVLHSDEWFAYRGLSRDYDHRVVEHGKGIYATEDSHTNTIEGAWSILKRMIIGIYHKTSRKHLQRYVDEFVFRYNTRKQSEADRFNAMLSNLENRLTYKELING